MPPNKQEVIERIFESQDENGLWKVIPESHKYYPACLHYVPTYKATLWVLIQLAELECDNNDDRVKKPLQTVKNHLFDEKHGIYSLKEDHFPIPCLNGNMLYLDGYFNGGKDSRNLNVLQFFYENQRFDDGVYDEPKNSFCSNTSCYGKHTCYWGVVKLLKGISHIHKDLRTKETEQLKDKCIKFILKHRVYYSSHNPEKLLAKRIDSLTFPNFYKSDFLEILWILKREGIHTSELEPALKLLKSKRTNDGEWELERSMNNMVASIGPLNKTNQFVTKRALEVLEYYKN